MLRYFRHAIRHFRQRLFMILQRALIFEMSFLRYALFTPLMPPRVFRRRRHFFSSFFAHDAASAITL